MPRSTVRSRNCNADGASTGAPNNPSIFLINPWRRNDGVASAILTRAASLSGNARAKRRPRTAATSPSWNVRRAMSETDVARTPSAKRQAHVMTAAARSATCPTTCREPWPSAMPSVLATEESADFRRSDHSIEATKADLRTVHASRSSRNGAPGRRTPFHSGMTGRPAMTHSLQNSVSTTPLSDEPALVP